MPPKRTVTKVGAKATPSVAVKVPPSPAKQPELIKAKTTPAAPSGGKASPPLI